MNIYVLLNTQQTFALANIYQKIIGFLIAFSVTLSVKKTTLCLSSSTILQSIYFH